MSFWDIIWFIVISYLFIAYLMLLFNVIRDIFRDQEMSGIAKAVWLVALLFLPLLTLLVYLIARGSGMAKRDYQARQQAQSAQDDYIKSVAGATSSPTAEIEKAKSLLDSGAISQAEFDALKQKALA
ncbi:MAG TPA: SHOCT domain-containing protein [Nocardioides sp.]|nr:SHOCT domain-containing protein [Nocardioides sp.]